jgi:hypothetical protein
MTKVINDLEIQRRIDFTPHRFQQEILDAFDKGKREIVVSAGRRSGKSAICGYILARELLSSDKQSIVVSPSYDLTERVLEYVRGWLRLILKQPIPYQSKPFPKIVMNWREGASSLEGRSSEFPEGILGKSYDVVVVDEAGLLERKIWEQHIFPALTSKKGKAIFIGTPRGKNWFYERFIDASQNPDGFAIQFTSKDNPYFPSEEWNRAKLKLPKDVFRQEFQADFIEGSAGVFKNVRDLISPDLPREPIAGHFYVGGLDLAQVSDFSALTIIDKSVFPYEVVFCERWQKLEYPTQLAKVLGILNRFPHMRITIDSRNVGAMFSEQLRREGIWTEDFQAVGTISKDWQKRGSKEKLVEKALQFIEGRQIRIPYYEPLLSELEIYSYNISEAGNIHYGHPIGSGNDDCVDSLMLALWQLPFRTITQKTPLEQAFEIQRQRIKRSAILRQDTGI